MNERPLLLIVEDDDALRERLARAFDTRGFEVETAASGADAEAALARETPEFVVLDLRIAGASGLDLIPKLIHADPATRIVVLTGYGSIASAVEAMRLGAHNYVSKPADADDVLAAVMGEARPVPSSSTDAAPPPTLARAEWEHIQRILGDTGGNVSETARRLGITRRTLQLKLKKYPPRV